MAASLLVSPLRLLHRLFEGRVNLSDRNAKKGHSYATCICVEYLLRLCGL